MFLKDIISRLRARKNGGNEEGKMRSFDQVMGIFLKALKVIGALPIGPASTGWKVKMLSATSLYSIIVYFCGLGMTILTVSKLVDSFDKVPFEEKIFLQLLTMASISHSLIPLTTWPDSFNIGHFLNSWTEFQSEYLRVTRTPLIIDINNVARRSVYFSSFMILQFVLVTRLYPAHVPLQLLVNVGFNMTFALAVMFFWLISMIIVGNTGKILAKSFKETVESGLMSFQTMRNYHRLWIHLNGLTTETGNVMYRSYCMPLSMQLCFLVLALYASVSFFVRGEHRLLVLYLSSSVTTLGALAVFCTQGYYAPIKVKSIQNELHKLNFLNTNVKVLQEARRFLETIKLNPPLITLGGFIDINREMMSSACATLTTYLVVVLQFRLNET